jgi:hypothetical protein
MVYMAEYFSSKQEGSSALAVSKRIAGDKKGALDDQAMTALLQIVVSHVVPFL